MRAFSAVPLVGLVILIYNLMAFAGVLDTDATAFSVDMSSGAMFALKTGDVFTLTGLVALFFEMLKAARLRAGTVLDHILSTAVLIVALIEFLLVGACATAAFFLLTCMALADVVAGFSVSIFSARRDFTVDRDSGGL
jgi:hypothetical protein